MADIAVSRSSVRGRLMRSVRGWVSQYPRLYLPMVANRRAFDGTLKAVGKQTDVVIEGFPRCGNSFAFAAFRHAQQRPVNIAHHLHASAQVLAAVKRGIPTLVVVRSPDEAVVSFLLRAPGWTPREAYTAYMRFYTCIAPVRDRFVVATFEQVISDFGKVVRRMNHEFGTDFSEFDHTPENVERCFANLDRIAVVNGRRGDEFEMGVARPSAAREERKAEVRERIQSDNLRGIRRSAAEIYDLYAVEARS